MKRLLNVCAENSGNHLLAADPNTVTQARGDLERFRVGKHALEKDIHTQLDINQRLNTRVSSLLETVSDLESKVKSLTSQLSQLDPDLASTAVAENVQLAQEKNVLVKENDALKIAIKAQNRSLLTITNSK